MNGYAYYDGEFGAKESIRIPLCDRSVFFGDSVYDAMIGEGGVIYQAEEHIARLLGNCERLGFYEIPTSNKISELLHEVVRRSGLPTYFVYIQISRRKPRRSHPAVGISDSGILITVDDFSIPSPTKTLKTIICDDKRYEYCNIKTTNLMPNVFASEKATRAGATEALLHRGDRVTEGAHSSILMVKNGEVVMPPLDELILPGITRRVLHDVCDKNGIPVSVRVITVDELMAADEIILCSTTKNILYVYEIDGKAVGGKDRALAERLQELFLDEVYKDTGVRL